jgi:hypothetical protein
VIKKTLEPFPCSLQTKDLKQRNMAVDISSTLRLDDPRPADDPRWDLKALLLSKSFYIPNLKPLYKDWKDAVNPHYSQLKEALEKRIIE